VSLAALFSCVQKVGGEGGLSRHMSPSVESPFAERVVGKVRRCMIVARGSPTGDGIHFRRHTLIHTSMHISQNTGKNEELTVPVSSSSVPGDGHRLLRRERI